MFSAIVLAAGSGSRMGGGKMLMELHGKPLVCHTVDAALASSLRPIVVVGNIPVIEALGDRAVTAVINAEPGSGMSQSIALGIKALPDSCDGTIVMLGDMPGVLSGTLDTLAKAASHSPQSNAVVPVYLGRRGNPVLLRRALFPHLAALEGDKGARLMLMGATEVEVTDAAILVDIDTVEDLAFASLTLSGLLK